MLIFMTTRESIIILRHISRVAVNVGRYIAIGMRH